MPVEGSIADPLSKGLVSIVKDCLERGPLSPHLLIEWPMGRLPYGALWGALVKDWDYSSMRHFYPGNPPLEEPLIRHT